MPLYQYQCSKCGIKHELLCKSRETAPQYNLCPVCSEPSERLPSSGSFRIKEG